MEFLKQLHQGQHAIGSLFGSIPHSKEEDYVPATEQEVNVVDESPT